jgi:ATP-dependent Clp protease ATP-binding subunit ClpA
MAERALVDVMPVLAWCTRAAQRASHPHVGTEHLALAALDGPGGLGEIARLVGVDPADVRARLETVCTESRLGACDDEARATPRVVRMLAGVAQLALLEGEPRVLPRHLVAMLLSDTGSVAWAALRAAGLPPEVVGSAVRVDRTPANATAPGGPN